MPPERWSPTFVAAAAEARPPAGAGLPSNRPDRRFLLLASVAGMAVTGLACVVLHLLSLAGSFGKLSNSLFITPFWTEAAHILAGGAPYRDVPLEYPPLSLPVFLLPALLPGGGLDYPRYRTMFEILMAACAIGLVPIVAWTVARLDGRRDDVVMAIGLVTLTPFLLGPLAISRYDLWPALLTAAATLAMVSRRPRVAFALLALAILAKVYPVFLVPIFAWHAWRSGGSRAMVASLGVGLAVGLAGLLPFVALSPDGALEPFIRTLARPLQVESLGASVLAGLHHWLGVPFGPVEYSFESYNLRGPGSDEISTIQSVVLVVGLVVVWLLATRSPGGRTTEHVADGTPDASARSFVLACAAALAVTVAFGKVLSPQYVLWLVPAVAVLGPVAAGWPALGMGAILILTQAYYPALYERYVIDVDPAATLTVLERNLGLVALAVYLVVLMARSSRSSPRGPARRRDRPAGQAPSAA
jgi:Glycosyltransferase family 87